MNIKLKLLLIALGLLLCGQVSATVVYGLKDFNAVGGAFGSEWSGATWHAGHSIVDGHIGDYSLNGGTTLTLTGLGAHTQIALEFDLYLFNTWDGNNTQFGPDFFSLAGDVHSPRHSPIIRARVVLFVEQQINLMQVSQI